MRGKPKRLYWDTCVILAWIKNETCWPEDVLKGIEQTVEEWRARSVVIVTSAITMLEILSSQMTKEQKDAFAKVFSDPHLQLIDVDRRIAGKASAIRSHYDDRQFKPDGGVLSGRIMGMGDAIHLATAIHHEVLEFQTLDGLSKKPRAHDLLALDGNVAGARLSIRLPKYVPPPEPLHGPISTTKGDQTKLSFDLEGQPELHEKESELAPVDSIASTGGSDPIAEEMRQEPEDGPSGGA